MSHWVFLSTPQFRRNPCSPNRMWTHYSPEKLQYSGACTRMECEVANQDGIGVRMESRPIVQHLPQALNIQNKGSQPRSTALRNEATLYQVGTAYLFTCMCRSLFSMLLGAGFLAVPDLPHTGSAAGRDGTRSDSNPAVQ